MFLVGRQLTSTLWFREPGSLCLGLLTMALGPHTCLHQAGRGKCMDVQMLQGDSMNQAWKWYLSLPLTFLWLELNHVVISNWKWSREDIFSGRRGKQGLGTSKPVTATAYLSAWSAFALRMKTGMLWVGNIHFGCSRAIFVCLWFLRV